MKIQESGEMYLKTILNLQNELGVVRSVDVAAALDFSKPSVSRAMSILRDAGYITMDEHRQIILTEKGYEKASSVLARYHVISTFLMKTLDLDQPLAEREACQIEHIITDETFHRMQEYNARHGEEGAVE